MASGEVRLDAGDELSSVMLDPPAGRALEVELFVRMCQLPMSSFIGTEPGLAHEAKIGEQRQGPIHRREVHTRIRAPNTGGNLVGSEMGSTRRHDVPHRQAGTREPKTCSTERLPQIGVMVTHASPGCRGWLTLLRIANDLQ